MSLLQNEDFKTEAQITGAGGTASQLLNDTKIWVSANSINKTLDDAIVDGDLGGGGGGGSGSEINYITNTDLETDASGWTAYDDASATPVDGTGGSPVSTFTRSTSSPLRGTASGLFAKPASNEQGDGVGYAFSIATADKGELCHIKFEYSTTANYVSGYIGVYVYDVTNAALISRVTFKDVAKADNGSKHIAYFLASETSTSYRLIFHNTTSTTTAWDFKIDNIIVGPSDKEFCSYGTNAGQSISNNSQTRIVFEDELLDSYGSMNTGTGVYTFKKSGAFKIHVDILFDPSTNWAAGERVTAYLIKNGSTEVKRTSYYLPDTAGGSLFAAAIPLAHLGDFLAGDTVEYKVIQNSGASLALNADVTFNRITINKVG